MGTGIGAGIRPGTEGAKALKNRWDAVFRMKANEEMAVANDFDAPEGVDMIGDKLWIRIVPLVSAQTLASTDQGAGGTNLTYHVGTIDRIGVDPVFIYAAVSLPDHLISRLGSADAAQLESVYRKQMLAAMDAQIDVSAASLFSSISAVKGPANLDKVTLLDAQTTLATYAKQHYVIGQTTVNLKYHPSQIKNINAIAEVANANYRGDAANPNVKGVVLKAWGMTLTESGNIQFTGGTYQNALFLSKAFILAWNRKPFVKPTIDFELTRNVYCEADFGVAELFDEDAVLIKSA